VIAYEFDFTGTSVRFIAIDTAPPTLLTSRMQTHNIV